ncbi:MAG: SAM-dependent methyltransferase [Thermoleophilia bacterium]|nr:SAM-dependent methyltransferase [Thermoleophilia bacterium]
MPAVPDKDTLLADLFEGLSLTRAVLSKPRDGALPAKVTVEPVELRGETAFRFTSQLPDRATHENLSGDAARERLGVLLADYGQGLLQTPEADWQVLGEKVLRRPPTRAAATRGHDRRKRYLLEEGTPVPFLVELGVMTPEGQVRKQRYDKFRQVNRFLELVDDVVPSLRPEGVLRVVDFGCGKSYLTFAIHHLLTELRGREVEIVGLDLKADVIETCSAFAARAGLAGIRFEEGDIAGFDAGGGVDLVVSLHACDTATDEALAQAVRWGADAILAVPCCQKEAYRQLESSLLAPLLRHGLAKERFAALVTDTLRAQLLELAGYRTQLVEFVPLEHTAKNVLIRAARGRPAGEETRREYEELRDSLGLEPTLERLLSAA